MNNSKQVKSKLIVSTAVLASVALALMIVLVNAVQNKIALTVILGILIVALAAYSVGCALFFAKSVGRESFDKGMSLVAESIPLTFSVLNQQGQAVYCNEEAARMFALKNKQEFLDRLFTDLIPQHQPDGTLSAEKAGRHIQTAFATGRDNFQWWQQTLERKPFPIDVTVVSGEIHGQMHLLVYSKDLRKDHEAKIKQKELTDRIQGVMDASPLLCAVFDDEGNVLDVNHAVLDIFGIQDKQIFMDNFKEFLPDFQPDGKPSFAKGVESLKKTLAEGGCRYEFVYQYKGGELIPTEEIQRLITVEGRNLIISYSRDLREFYKIKDKEMLVQQSP
ncbi:MAG: PAS domain-containing protein [Treponema sp.]|nr:PAS domain-containing protein [Treponema sp.]